MIHNDQWCYIFWKSPSHKFFTYDCQLLLELLKLYYRTIDWMTYWHIYNTNKTNESKECEGACDNIAQLYLWICPSHAFLGHLFSKTFSSTLHLNWYPTKWSHCIQNHILKVSFSKCIGHEKFPMGCGEFIKKFASNIRIAMVYIL